MPTRIHSGKVGAGKIMGSTIMSDEKTRPDCPCTWPGCPRHGNCDACKAYHHGMGEKTCCEKKGGD